MTQKLSTSEKMWDAHLTAQRKAKEHADRVVQDVIERAERRYLEMKVRQTTQEN